MKPFNNSEVWFVTGSQHLYGPETLKLVGEHSQKIADALNKSESIPVKVVFKPVVKTPEEIYNTCVEANTNKIPLRAVVRSAPRARCVIY